MKNKKLTKAEKRVLIAKDVLKLLNRKKIIPLMGEYLSLPYDFYKNEINPQDPLEDTLRLAKQCEVCALGSLLYAHVNRFNSVKTKDVMRANGELSPTQSQTIIPLLKYFSEPQLQLIEKAFEGQLFDFDVSVMIDYNPVPLRYIMKNIIKNNGIFKFDEELKNKFKITELD